MGSARKPYILYPKMFSGVPLPAPELILILPNYKSTNQNLSFQRKIKKKKKKTTKHLSLSLFLHPLLPSVSECSHFNVLDHSIPAQQTSFQIETNTGSENVMTYKSPRCYSLYVTVHIAPQFPH